MEKILLDNKEITINEDLSWRDVGKDLVALNTTTGEYFTFNSTGRIIWLSIAEGTTMECVVDRIVSEYKMDKQSVISDTALFIDSLVKNGLMKIN